MNTLKQVPNELLFRRFSINNDFSTGVKALEERNFDLVKQALKKLSLTTLVFMKIRKYLSRELMRKEITYVKDEVRWIKELKKLLAEHGIK